MIEARPSGICQCESTLQSHDFNCMNSKANTIQFDPLPIYTNPDRVLGTVGHNGYEFGGLLKRDPTIKYQGLFEEQSVSHVQSPILATNQYSKKQKFPFSAGVDCRSLSLGAYSPQGKKFLIFDSSGDETRLIFSSLGSSAIRNQTDLATKPILRHQKYPKEHLDIKFVRACPEAPILCEESNVNHTVNGEGSDYHEDTDEINALLYSDSDDDDAKCDTEDEDEVSTGHSPLAIKVISENAEPGDDIDDEACSLDIFSKRQKLLNGGCSKSSFIDAQRVEIPPPKLYEEESVVDLSTSHGNSTGTILGNKRLRKDKIRDTLKVLEKLIPGPTSEDPLMIIDQAIDYLKYLKLKAKSLSLDNPESSSCYGPLP